MATEAIEWQCGSPGAGLGMAELLASHLGDTDPLCLHLGFAFLSDSGLRLLESVVASYPEWGVAERNWLIGIRHGITEPVALERLLEDSAEVRVFIPGGRLTADSLRSGNQFHGKVVAVRNAADSTLQLLHAGSANLTSAAIGPAATNYEAGITLLGVSASGDVQRGFDDWWQGAWAASSPLTEGVIERYSELREELFEENPALLEQVDPPALGRIETANHLWIEAGAMSGGARNQVEFNRELARFFGEVSEASRRIVMSANGVVRNDRPLTPKTTSFGVAIWRLGLPTEAQVGLSYPGKVIHITRRSDSRGFESFEVEVGEPGDSHVRRWRAEANKRGYLGMTSGQRVFGFY